LPEKKMVKNEHGHKKEKGVDYPSAIWQRNHFAKMWKIEHPQAPGWC
jgi:hypothetical protein